MLPLTLYTLALKAAVVAKLVMSGILSLTSSILALRAAAVAKLVMLGIWSYFSIKSSISSSVTNISYSFFNIFDLSILETGSNLLIYLSTLLFKLLKLIGTIFNLSISNLSTSDFKSAKSVFLAKSDVSTTAAFFKNFVAYLDKSNSTFTFAPKDLGFRKCSLMYAMSFWSIQLLKELR